MRRDRQRREAVIRRLLIGMGAVRFPDTLVPEQPAEQRQRRIAHMIERQDQRRDEAGRAGDAIEQICPISPMESAPTSPRNSRATGLLNGAKREARKERRGDQHRFRRKQMPRARQRGKAGERAKPATVIQSSPSMKLVRFTNQTPARMASARSSPAGSHGRPAAAG